MNVQNKTKRLICIMTLGGRVDIIPGVITNSDLLDGEKGKNKIFDHYLSEGELKEVTGSAKGAKGADKAEKLTPKQVLQAEFVDLGGEPGEMTVVQLEEAIAKLKA